MERDTQHSCMQLLKKAGQALAEGDFSCTVDTAQLRGDLRQHGENLSSVREGVCSMRA